MNLSRGTNWTRSDSVMRAKKSGNYNDPTVWEIKDINNDVWHTSPYYPSIGNYIQIPFEYNVELTQNEECLSIEGVVDLNGYTLTTNDEELSNPSGFSYTRSFKVYRRYNGTFYTDLNPLTLKVPVDVTYYLSPTGDDSNDGLTVEEPKQSLINLVSALNATPPVTGATIYLASGEYDYTIGGRALNFTFPVNIICETADAIVSTADESPIWVTNGTYPNLWQSFKKGDRPRASSIYDKTQLDEFGNYKKPVQVASATIVNTTVNSMQTGTGSILVRLADSREPDDDVKQLIDTYCINQTSAVSMYFEGVSFYGGEEAVKINHSGAVNICFYKCQFGYSFDANVLSVTLSSSSAKVYTIECKAHYATQDGFNYHSNPTVLEVDSTGVYNGDPPTSSSNGTTIHDNVKIIRIGGIYQKNNTRNLHDVGNSKGWNLGCKAGQSLNGSSDPYESSSFCLGIGSDDPEGWFDTCESVGGSASDFAIRETASMHHIDSIGADVVYNLGSYATYTR